MQFRNSLSITILLLLGLVWGTGYSIARFAMTNGISPLGYSFWQSLGPALFLFLLTLFQKSSDKKISLSHLKYYFICGLTGIVIPNTNMYFAAQHLPAGILAVTVNTVPLIVYLMALASRTESFQPLRLLGVLAAMTGLMIIVFPKVSIVSSDSIPWILRSLITPFCFAFCSVYISRFCPTQSTSLQSASGTLICSSLLLFPIVIMSHQMYSFHYPFSLPDKIILLEIILSSLGYILFFQLIKIAGPVYYSFVDTIVALTGLFWGYFLFQERLNEWTTAAVMLILIGLWLVNKRQQESPYVKTAST